jgi:hypothetical protein
MSRNRSISALTDDEHRLVAAAEQDLSRLLSVEPSPAFAANIRARVSEEERPGQWRGRWAPIALVASVVAIAGIAILLSTMAGEPAMEHGAGAAAARRDVSLPADMRRADAAGVTADPGPSRTLGRESRRAEATFRAPNASSPPRPTEVARDPRPSGAEVLIDPQRRDDVNRLLAMLRSGTANVPVATTEAQDLTVSPVVVEQLDVPLLYVTGESDEINDLRR